MLLRYMFLPEREIPAGVGFTHFDPAHLTAIGVIAVWSVGMVWAGCRLRPAKRKHLMRWMAGMMIALELGKDAYLIGTGAFSVGYLPLHLCSLAMFLCLYLAWRPNSDWAGQLVWSVCFSGGLAALLFPDWINMPVYHILSLHSFLYHGMLVQFALIAVITGQARPRLGKLWKVGVFLIAVAIPVYLLNLRLGTNYMFLNRPLVNTPLALCARLPGRCGYLTGYGLLAAVVLVLLDLPFSLWAAWKHMHSTDGQA